MSPGWPVLEAARAQRVPRVPFRIDGRAVGSVAQAHLEALQAWPECFALDAGGVRLLVPRAGRDAALARVHDALRAQGLVRAWRDEPFVLPDPDSGEVLATIERAAARFWGTLTAGAHATGFVRGADGRPAALWIARRAPHKATDPGRFDNLVGGGVGAGQTPAQALVREGFEEAGLAPAQAAAAQPAGVLRLARDVAEGFQHEWLHAFDLELPHGWQPHNHDGEVAGFTLMPVAEAAALAAGDAMTVDAALVTLDFLVRQRLLSATPDPHPALHVALDALRVVRPR